MHRALPILPAFSSCWTLPSIAHSACQAYMADNLFPLIPPKLSFRALQAPMCRCMCFLPTFAFGAFRPLQASMTGKALARSVMSSRLIMLLPSLSTVCVCESLRQKPLTQQPLLPPRVELPPTVELLPRLRVFLTPAASSRQPDTAWTLCLA